MFRWRVGARWYAFAFLVPIGINVAAVYLNAALGAPAPPASGFFALDPMLIGSVMSKSRGTLASRHTNVKDLNLNALHWIGCKSFGRCEAQLARQAGHHGDLLLGMMDHPRFAKYSFGCKSMQPC